MLDDPDILYPIDEVLVISAIGPDHHILEPGEMDAILAHQRPNLRDIVLQAGAFDAELFIEERALSIPLVASRCQDDLVLEHFSAAVEDGSDLQLAVLVPGEADVLRFYDRIVFKGTQLENSLSRVK